MKNVFLICLSFVSSICSEYVGEWEPSDDPATEHRELFPYCPFMRGESVGNVPVVPVVPVVQPSPSVVDEVTMADADEDETSFGRADVGERARVPEATVSEDETGIRRRDLNSGQERGKIVFFLYCFYVALEFNLRNE